jgi:hypothetical protein
MTFEAYVRHIAEHGKAPEGVKRPPAIHLAAAEGGAPRVLSAPATGEIARRFARFL